MADEYILKHLQDILTAINDLEKVFIDYPNRFDVFEKDNLLDCLPSHHGEGQGGAISLYPRRGYSAKDWRIY